MNDTLVSELSVALGLLVGLALALEAGFRVGRRAGRRREKDKAGGQLGAIQGAVLGLLGLLLGFSFAGAAGRFVERQDLILQEANMIGTAYLRADLLDEPHAGLLRRALAEYTRHRVEASRTLGAGMRPELGAEVAEFHTRMWNAARDGVLAKPAVTVAVLGPVNDVIDMHSTRVFAGKKRLPALVLGLLMSCSLLAVGAIGYGCGISGDRAAPMTASLVLVVGATLWTTIDLDRPRAGLLRLSDEPLKQLSFGGTP